MGGSTSLRDALLRRAWAQWIALGVSAVGEPDSAVVDLEALIALTAELGDADARLRDTSTDWCVGYGRYVNGARLRQVARELGTPSDAIGEYVATIAAAGGPRWPMATRPRPDYHPRGKARLEDAASRARFVVRLRAAYGVNARADILAALLASPGIPVSASDLARRTRFTKPTVSFALDALLLGGLVEARAAGNERRFLLKRGAQILPDLRPPVPQPGWVDRYAVALAVLRFSEQADGMTATVRAVEARGLADRLLERLKRERLPTPDLRATGVDFAVAFDRWVVELGQTLAGGGRV